MATTRLHLRCIFLVLLSLPLAFLSAQVHQDIIHLFSSASQTQQYRNVLKASQELTLDKSVLAKLMQEKPDFITLILPQSHRNDTLFLHSVKLLDDGFNVQNEKKEILPYTPGAYYRGVLHSGKGKTYAAFSFFQESVMGLYGDDGGDYVLGALRAKGEAEGSTHYILYNDQALALPNPFTCGADTHSPQSTHKQMGGGNVGMNPTSTNCVKVHFDADFALYTNKSSNVTSTTNYVTGLFNMVTSLYQAENITTVLNDVDVWTTQDPFSSASSLDALYDYGDYTQNNLQGANLAHLLSGVNAGNGGIAWIGILCFPYQASSHAGPYAYSNIDGVFSNVPTYSWDVEVTTHEMGHNLGSNHTHWCGWVGGAIDNCYATESVNGVSCPPGPAPTNGGTIMSYCHLSSTGINFNNGFGPQPNGAITSEVNGASCLSICNTTVYCSGLTTLSACTGSFNDGSGTNDYGNNSNCEWRISRPSGVIKLTFSSIATQSGVDLIRVYDGINSGAPLLATYSGTLSNVSVTSTSNNLYILFTSDGNTTAAGFAASYSALPIKPIITGNAYFCPGGSTTLTVSPTYSGVTYSWSNGATGISTTANTVSSLTVTGTNVCGSTTSSAFNVQAGSFPTVNAGIDKTTCLGTGVLIGTTAITGTSYSWTPATGLTSTTVTTPTANPSVTTTYILTAKQTASGCTKNDTVKVFVNPLPTANAGVDKAICKGSSTSIGGAAATGMTYSWTPTTGLSSSTISNPIATPTTTTSYILTVTNAATGCIKKDTAKVTVNIVPAANAGTDKTICKGASTVLGAGPATGVTYSWTPSTALSSSILSNPSATPTVTTTYILTATQTTGGCTKKDTVKITVNPLPTATAGTDKTICKGASVTLGTTATTGMNYTWSPTTALSSAFVSNPVATPTVTTNYILTVVNATTGCSKKDTVKVTVNTVPVANAGLDKTICMGASTVLGTTAVSGVTYSWSPITALSSSTISNPTATPTATTNYILTATQTTGGCTKKDTVKVTVNPLPTATAGTDKTICKEASVTLGTTATAGMNYTWSPTTTLSSAFVSNPVATPTVTTNYILTVVNATTGCLKKDTVKVTVNTVPVANAGLDRTICQGTSTVLGTTAVSGVTYAWSPVTALNTSTMSNPTATPSVTTNYILTATQTTGGCTKKDTVKVTVNPKPTATAGTDKSICVGSSVTLGAASIAGMSYTWTPTTALSATNISNPVATPTTSIAYYMTVTNTTTGCVKKDTVNVIVNPLPVPNAGADQTICAGSSVVIGAASMTGFTYTWSPSATLSSAYVSNPTATTTSTINYIMTMVNSTTNCSKKDTVKVNVNPLPTANAGLDKTIAPGASTVIGTTGNTANTYTWTPATALNNAFVAMPTASPTTSTTYTVTVKVTATGCTKTDQVLVTVTGANAGAKAQNEDWSWEQFSAYPNPVGDILTLESSDILHTNLSYSLCDAMGMIVAKGVFSLENQSLQAQISTQNLSKGIYILHLQTTEGHQHTMRIIKE